jgi:hypothetical protein
LAGRLRYAEVDHKPFGYAQRGKAALPSWPSVDVGEVTRVKSMRDSVHEFLNEHPTFGRWLEDIIDVLIGRRGTAHVKLIADDLVKANKAREKDTTEQIVTRQINDFCSDAADFAKDTAHDLFERVEPATYRLRSYPERPRVIELVCIEFDDVAMQSMWGTFRDAMKKQQPIRWRESNNERKLGAFTKWMAREQNHAEYERRKAVSAPSLDAIFDE